MFHSRARSAVVLLLVLVCASARVSAQQPPDEPPPPVAVPYRSGDRWGLANRYGQLVADCIYSHIPLRIYPGGALVPVAVERPRDASGLGGGEAWGVIDAEGRPVLPTEYDAVVVRGDGIVFFRSGGQVGAASATGQIVAPLGPETPQVARVDDLIWVARSSEPAALFTSGGAPIAVPAGGGEDFTVEGGVVRFFSGDRVTGFGLVDVATRRVVRLDRYAEVQPFHAGRALVATPSGLYGFIDEHGTEVVPPQFSKADLEGFGADASNRARVARGNSLGLIDPGGKAVSQFRYDYIGRFAGKYAVVGVARRFGLVDDTGRELIAPTYESLGFWKAENTIHEGGLGSDVNPLLVASRGRRLGLVTVQGQVWVPFQYDELPTEPYWSYAYFHATGFIWARRDGRYAAVRALSGEIIHPSYDAVRIAHEMWDTAGFPVRVGRKWGFVDLKGVEVAAPSYDWMAGQDVAGMIVVRSAGRYGMIDAKGRVLLSTEYDEITPYECGFARVRMHDRYGIADRDGRLVTEIEYDEVGAFAGNLAPVRRGSRWGLVDTAGREAVETKYDRIDAASDRAPFRYRAVLGGKCMYLDERGSPITPLKYDAFGTGGRRDRRMWAYSSNRACVLSGGRYGFVDEMGREVVEPKYEAPAVFGGGAFDFALVQYHGLLGFVDKRGTEFFYDPPGSR